MSGKTISIMKILFSLILLVAFNFEIKANTYVVSVGIADYKYINDLRFTERDAITFDDIMSGITEERIILLGRDATHANISRTIRSAFAKAKTDDTVIFFFSGHGYEGGFCCYDMRPNSYIGGISYQEMQILFRNCRSEKKIVIADACFSGGLSKQKTQLTVQTVQNSDVIFFLSSRMDETSLELPDGPNGLFTYFLAKGLYGEADTSHDTYVTIKEIYDYVSRGVIGYAQQIPHDQHPTIWGKYNSNLKLIKWKN